MKIGLLVCVDEQIEKDQMFGVKYMPVWAYTLASYLRELPGVEIFLYDTRIEKKNKTPHADLFFVSGINQDYEALIQYQKILRKIHPDSKIILGGPIVFSYQQIGLLEKLSCFDHLFLGDGEQAINQFVLDVFENNISSKLYHSQSKFKLSEARAMDFQLLKENKDKYYGGVIEVSRGCPFLCEFCDIRTKPDNNRSNNKQAEILIQELEQYAQLGIPNILFACDNFIGDHVWAEMICDKIIELKEQKNYSFNIYTWLTINLYTFPKLMEKMKKAGFEMFFIGVESFGIAQLLETAKVQNAKTDIKSSIETIQSYGFIVVAGLIFGFDTDPESAVADALNGIKSSGIISGDPSLLTALPGTPLYARMKKSGRLRSGKIGLGGKKYSTNILYLRNREKMIEDFLFFTKSFNHPQFQYERYNNFLKSIKVKPEPKSKKAKGYINLKQLSVMAMQNPEAILSLLKRLWGVINSPLKIYYIAKALTDTLKNPYARLSYFYFWLFNWSNSVLKYGHITAQDFDIDSVKKDFALKDIIPADYETDFFEPIPHNKIKAQRAATITALNKLITNAE